MPFWRRTSPRLVALLLAPPVKNAIQNMLDRAFYRDRYDYRRALVGFARDLNSDLDLNRLSERLVTRVMETLLVDRMALMLAPVAVVARLTGGPAPEGWGILGRSLPGCPLTTRKWRNWQTR